MSISFSLVSIVPKIPANHDDSLVLMSTQLFDELQLEKDKDLNLLLGKKTVPLHIQQVDIYNNEIHLPENIFKTFQLPIGKYKFQVKYQPECHTLLLGPVIGLLTDFYMNDKEEPDFRSVHTFCEELHQGISESGGFFYVFAYQEFLRQGYFFHNGSWISAELPLPDVVYNRIHSRRLEQVHSFKKFRSQLDQLDIPFFNDRFLSKWDVYQQLILENDSQQFIPETRVFSKEGLADFAQKYETVFIKPVHGSQGRNILKIKKAENGRFTIQTSFKSKAGECMETYSFEEIHQLIKSIMNNKIYIIQQGIPLLTYDGCTMDFRVLCHKNHINSWIVTSIVARVAAEEEFVSNIARGGKILKPLQALYPVMGKKKGAAVLKGMKALSTEIASIISKHSKGLTGELGIDMGVDQEGNLWLIEVNSKPSKRFEDPTGKIRPSAKAIIQFCTSQVFDTSKLKGEN